MFKLLCLHSYMLGWLLNVQAKNEHLHLFVSQVLHSVGSVAYVHFLLSIRLHP